jgi:purine-binding chemotaxis protein CheW
MHVLWNLSLILLLKNLGGKLIMIKINANEKLFATFDLDKSEYAIDVSYVSEAINKDDLLIQISSPNEFIEGIINIRGNVIPVFNLKKWFNFPNLSYGEECKIAITKVSDKYLGFLFDDINKVIRVKNDDVQELFEQNSEELSITNIIKYNNGKEIIQILNFQLFYGLKGIEKHLEENAQEKNSFHEDKNAGKEILQYISYSINSGKYGIHVSKIREIINLKDYNKLELIKLEDYIVCFINIREEIIPVIDSNLMLNQKKTTVSDNARVIIIISQGTHIGILADNINEVLNIYDNDIMEMPKMQKSSLANVYNGIVTDSNKNDVILLNIDSIFQDSIVSKFKKSMQIFLKDNSQKYSETLSAKEKKNSEKPKKKK